MAFVPSYKQILPLHPHRRVQQRRPPPSGDAIASDALNRVIASPPRSFSDVVNAPYFNPPRPPPSPQPWIRRSSSASSSHTQIVAPVRPQTGAPSMPETEPEEEYDEDETTYDHRVPRDIQWRPAYEPEPRWAWASDQPLSRTQVLIPLASEPMCKTDLVRGVIGTRNVTFIRRNWTRAPANETGLYKELKLFSSERYLRPLQGAVVPYLINVYDDVDTVALVLEPPHHTFWMEASPELPNVLKKRIVEAYIKLHQQGVLHGAADTHNILINAEGQIMLMDFSQARATRPLPELGLFYTDKKELDLELRRVMFKLNYEGAWRREQAKMTRVTEQAIRNEERREKRHLKAQGLYTGPISPDELPTPEDHAEPPPYPIEWNKWCASLGKSPKRFIVPGQTNTQVGITIRDFYVLVKRLEREHVKDMTSPLLASGPLFLLPVPYTPFISNLLNTRKRKASEDLGQDEHLAKRLHEMLTPPQSSAPAPKAKFSSKSYSTGTSETLLPAASSSSTSSKRPSEVKVKDFADIPYEGPRGFYFPFPPNEYIMSSHRVAYIRNANAIEAGRLGLPYYRADINMLRPPSYRRPLPKGMNISLGNLKRKREAGEGKAPITREEQREAKRQRFMEERAASLEEDRPIRFSDDVAHVDMPLFVENSDRRLSAPFSVPYHRKNIRRRSILKRTPTVKTVSYDLRRWPFEDPLTSKPQIVSVAEPPPSSAPPSVSAQEGPARSSGGVVVAPVAVAAGPAGHLSGMSVASIAGVLNQVGSLDGPRSAGPPPSSGNAAAAAVAGRAQVAQQELSLRRAGPPPSHDAGARAGAVGVTAGVPPELVSRAEAAVHGRTGGPRRLSMEELEEAEVEQSLEDEIAAVYAHMGEDEDDWWEDQMLMDVYAWLAMRPGGVGLA